MTLFAINKTCDSLADTVSYTGLNYSTFDPLNASTSFVTVDPQSGAIAVTSSAPVGTFQIQIIGNITSNGQRLGVTVTLIGIRNTAPFIETGFPLSYVLKFNSLFVLKIPTKDLQD